MSAGFTLFTPTYVRDYDRFCLQRESIERCGIDLPHIAAVNDEDLPKFRDMPHRKRCTFVSTRDLLPPEIEARRRVWGVRRRNPRRWFAGPPMHGWGVQQLLKLAAPGVVQTDGIICLDSDTIFLAKMTDEDFLAPDGKVSLYETWNDVDAEMAEWLGRSMRFLGVKATHQPISRYTHSPVVFHRQTVLDMHEHIEKQHGKTWIEAMDAWGMIMEYTTYGVFARYVDGLKRVTPTPPRHSLYYWWPEEAANVSQTLAARVPQTGAKILAVQSNSGQDISAYRPILEEIWKRVA